MDFLLAQSHTSAEKAKCLAAPLVALSALSFEADHIDPAKHPEGSKATRTPAPKEVDFCQDFYWV